MKSKDIATLKLSSEGGQAVAADIARVNKAISDIKHSIEGWQIESRRLTGEIGKQKSEITKSGNEIEKQNKIVARASEKNKELQAKIKELTDAGKTGQKQFENTTRQLKENNIILQEAQTKVEQLTQQHDEQKNVLQGLQASQKEYNRLIKDGKNEIGQHEGTVKNLNATLNLNQLSIKQLKDRQRELRKELNGISKALYPDKWNKLNNELQAVEKQLDKVAIGGKKTNDSFDRMKGAVIMATKAFIAFKALQIFQNILREIGDFIKQAPEVAAKAQGITNAFKKLNDTKLMATLRKETKGLVNDIELMKASVRADYFVIPINNLGKYLKFAQQRAQATGESVDYLVNSIVNGIGRKSPLILDNLGISAARLKEEMSRGADIVQATTKIVEEELAKQGNIALTTAEKAQQASVKWENAQLKIGKRMTWISRLWSTISGKMADGFVHLVDGSQALSRELIKEQQEMNRLVAIVNNQNISQETRNIILQELNSYYPTLLSYMDLERDGLDALNLKLIEVNKQYDNRIRLALVNEKELEPIQRKREELLERERKILNNLGESVDIYNKKKPGGISKELENIIKSGEIASKSVEEINNLLPKREGHSSLTTNQAIDNIRSMIKELKKIPPQLKENANAQAKILEKQAPILKEEKELKEKELDGMIELLEKRKEELKVAESVIAKTEEEQIAKDNNVRSLQKQIKILKDKIDVENGVIKQTDSLIEQQEELLAKAKEMPETTEKEITEKNKLISTIEKEIKRLKELGVVRDGGNGSSVLARQKKELDTQLTDLENAHKTELQLLKEAQIKNKQTDEEYKIAVAKSDKKYYDERIKALTDFKDQISDKKFQSDIDKQVVDATGKSKEQDPIIDQANVSKLGKNRDESLRFEQVGTNALKQTFAEREENEKVHALRMQTLDLTSAQNRLQILRQYSKEVQELDIADAKQKEELIREANDAVIVAETETIQKRKALDKSYFDSDKSVREQYGMVTLSEQKKNELDILEAFHKAELTIDGITYSQKLIAEETYQKAKQAIEDRYRNENLQTKIQYGIASEKEIYEAKLEQIQKDLDSEKITKEQADAAIWQAKLERAIAFGQEISQITSAGVNFGAALEQAATSKLEAEYEARIAAAEGNAAEQERLEQELAQKKLDLQKEYADLQFAMKASDIIANTAVAIMMALAQLGPITGPIAAALMGATGAAQLVTANAERQKVKSMTLGNSGKTSSGSGRVVVGLETGGYMDVTRQQDGKNFRASYNPNKRGYIDRPTVIVGEGPTGKSLEYVVPNEAMKNPTLRPVIDLIDHETRKGTVGTVDMNQMIRERLAGFQSGGSIDSSASTSSTNNVPMTANTQRQPSDVEIETLELLRLLNKNGVFTNLSLGSVKKGLDTMEKQDNKFKFGDQ